MQKQKRMAILGDQVIDTVSGFKGVAVAEHNYLHGCCRMTVQPPVNEKGELPEDRTFDLPQLEIVEENVAEIGDRTVGGPEKYAPGRRAGD